MEPFLNKFVSLVKHLLENSHKVQIIQSSEQYQTSLFCSRLTQEMSSQALVLNVDAASYLNNYQQDFFLDWAADQFEELLKSEQDKFDSPWLFVITQAHLLELKNIEQLLTLKHQRENAQLHLLFHFPEDVDIDKFLSGINDPIVTEQNYHIHSLPSSLTHESRAISHKKIAAAGLLFVVSVAALFLYHPYISVKKPTFDPSPAELFTDNSLGTWSDETEEKIDQLRDEIDKTDNEKTQSQENTVLPVEEQNKKPLQSQSSKSTSTKTLEKPDEIGAQLEQLTAQETVRHKDWSWQLIAFNAMDKAQKFKEKNCQSLCSIAQNQEYYVVLMGEYFSYQEGLVEKAKAQKIISNPWLRNTSELKNS